MTDVTIISLLPKLEDLTDEEYTAKIDEYRAWLEQHGDYGRLFMWVIGNKPGGPVDFIGIKIYNSEVAMLFKLMFEV